MMRRIAVCLVSLVLTSPVWAQEQESPPATGGSGTSMDMSKMGPWTRKPTQESKTKKEVETFLNEEDAIMKRRDFQSTITRSDFPIFMATDDSKGVPKAEEYDQQKYTEMMKSSMEQGPEVKDVKHKRTITVLSDSLATFTDEYTMTVGGVKRSGRNAGLLVKQGDAWKWKGFFEAGWGDQPASGVGGSGEPQSPGKDKDKDKDKPKQ
jgi:hypothetical protein